MEATLEALYKLLFPIFRIPQFWRVLLLLVLAGFLFRSIVNRLIPFLYIVISKGVGVVLKTVSALFLSLLFILTVPVRMAGRSPLRIVTFAEAIVTKPYQAYHAFQERYPKIEFRLWRRRFVLPLLIVSALLSYLVQQASDAPYAAFYHAWENRFIAEKLNPLGFQDVLAASAQAEESNQSAYAEEKPIYVRVSSGGSKPVNVRAEPMGKVLDVIRVGEEATYLLKQAEDNEGVAWYYIKNARGTAGWVSSEVVEMYQKE